MNPLERKAADLRDIFQGLVKHFKTVNSAAACWSHAQLNMQEMRVVEFIGEKGPRIMRELAEELGVAVNTVTGIVDELEELKLVSRQKSPEDRRINRVELTESGRSTYGEVSEMTLRFMCTMLGALTEDEQEIFMVLFRKIARAARTGAQALVAAPEDGSNNSIHE